MNIEEGKIQEFQLSLTVLKNELTEIHDKNNQNRRQMTKEVDFKLKLGEIRRLTKEIHFYLNNHNSLPYIIDENTYYQYDHDLPYETEIQKNNNILNAINRAIDEYFDFLETIEIMIKQQKTQQNQFKENNVKKNGNGFFSREIDFEISKDRFKFKGPSFALIIFFIFILILVGVYGDRVIEILKTISS